MKYFLIFALLISTCPIGLFAQDGQFPQSDPDKGTIFGRVIEEDADQPIAFANITVTKTGASKPFQVLTTKEGGRFIFRNVPYGHYLLEVSFLGYETYSQPIDVSKSNSVLKLGSIPLAVNTNQISEVEVVGEKQLEESSLDKKVFNISKNLTSTGGTALDALRNIPSLVVDMDGGIQLRGSSNVKVLVNGRPSSLIGSGGELNFEHIPASSIESIEVITNPSAKYEASGQSGVINIILKKPTNLGFNYTVNLLTGIKDQYEAGISMNYRTKRFNWRTAYRYTDKLIPHTHNSYRKNILEDTITYLDQTGDVERRNFGHVISFGADYQPTNKLTVFTTLTVNPNKQAKTSVFNYSYIDQFEEVDTKALRTTQDDADKTGLQGEFGIDKRFERKGMNWKTVYTYDQGDKLDSIYIDENTVPALPENLIKQKNHRTQTNTTHRVQSDFTYPFSKKTKLETGLMGSFRHLDNDFTFFDKLIADDTWVNNAGRSNHFLFDEQVLAGYMMATTKLGKLSANAGLRYEHTDLATELRQTNEATTNKYGHFFPSGYVGWDFFPKGKGTLQFSYSKRIRRPNYRRLNPFASYNDEQNIRIGNPNLRPELTDAIELAWHSRWKKGSISPALFYRHTDDKISYYAYLDSNDIRVTTFDNLNYSKSSGVEISGSYQFTGWLTLRGNVSYFKVEKNGENIEEGVSNEGNMAMTRFMIIAKPAKNWSIQTSTFYHTGFIGTLGQSEPMTNTDFGVEYRAFKNRGKFVLRVSDVFNTRQFKFRIETPAMETDMLRKRQTQFIWVGFNWQLKADKTKKRNKRKQSGDVDMEL